MLACCDFLSLDLFLDMFVINIASLDLFEIPLDIYAYTFRYINIYVYI